MTVQHRARMSCEDFDRLLYRYADDELAPGDRVLAESHLVACPACSRRIHHERRFREQLRQQVRAATPGAPEVFKERIRAGISRRRWRQRIVWLGAAGFVLGVVSSGAFFLSRPLVRQRFIDDAAARHARRFPLELAQPASARDIEEWFVGKLDHHVAVPNLPDARPAGARLLNVQEKQAAYISYDAHSPKGPTPRRVGLFVYDDRQHDVDFGGLDAASIARSRGFGVVGWRNGDLVYQLVTDMDDEDIRRMLTSDLLRAAPRSAPRALDVRPVSFPR